MNRRIAAARTLAANWRIRRRLPRLTRLATRLGFICRHSEWTPVREDCGGLSHYCRRCGIDAMDLNEGELETIESRPERERGEDDGREYGHPGDALAGLDS